MDIAYFLYYVGFVAASIGAIWLIKNLIANQKSRNSRKLLKKQNLKNKWLLKTFLFMKNCKKSRFGSIIAHWQQNYQVLGKIKLIEMTWDEDDNHLPTGRYFPILNVDERKALISMLVAHKTQVNIFYISI